MKSNQVMDVAFNEANRLAMIAKARFGQFRKVGGALAVPTAIVLLPSAAQAITAPAAGTFAFDLYDVAVNDMIKGAPGFVGGMVAVVLSAIQLSKAPILAGAGILGGTALIKADTITTSMGMII